MNGASNRRNFSYGTIAGYFQDNFKVLPRLTLNLGVRYDYYTRLTERDSLTLLPRLIGNNHVSHAAFERDARFRRKLRRAAVLLEGPQQFRPQRRLRLGRLRQRQNRGARRLQHQLYQ